MMDYYRFYIQKMVGGLVPTTMFGIKPGNLITFRYPVVDSTRANRRRLYRLVLVLGTWKSNNGLKLHGVKIEKLPWPIFRKFMVQILVHDTITLLKRRWELKAPIKAMINRQKSFYMTKVKILLRGHDCYRTYNLKGMRQIKIGSLDYSSLYSTSSKYAREILVRPGDVLSDMKREEKLLSQILGFDVKTTNDAKFKKLITERFGDVDTFIRCFREIEDYVDESASQQLDESDLIL